MLAYRRHNLALGALLLALGSVQAQNTAPATRPDPLNAQAAVPAPVYSSSLASYRRHADAEPIGWREANDNVARIGGWRAYARESAAASATPAASASSPTPANAGGATPGVRKP